MNISPGREGETRGELDNPILESYGRDERLAPCFRPFVLSGPVANALKRAPAIESHALTTSAQVRRHKSAV